MLWDSRIRVVVTGVALRSCLGNLEDTWHSLLLGKTGLQLSQPFPELSPYPLGLIGSSPLLLATLVNPLIQEALSSASLSTPLTQCGVVIGSSRGCQGEWENLLKTHSTQGWQEMLPHQAATLTARQLSTLAPVLSPMNACSTGIWAIARAYNLLQNRESSQVIAGAIETPITPLTITGFQQMGALSSRGCYPFERERDGLVLAEGAAVLILESLESALNRGVTPYAEIKGFGLTCDAYHMTAPEPRGTQAKIAIKECLRRSEMVGEEIDLVYTHGTATRLNDQREAEIIEAILPPNVQIASIKGAIGHTLGASSAISVALALLSLKHQVIPPAVGLKRPAFALNFAPEAKSAKLRNILSLSFGFGGQNAVLALAAVE